MTQQTLTIKEGNDPHCTHFEIIEDMIGTCKWYGRVKDYNRVPNREKMLMVTLRKG